ncbi:crotonase/enoyl-CoA hydratase family protein [Pseudoalteromonas sp. SSDWG2]|uniref:crotonase/enoyl-CoA hydratase family protein n=1 Tax=Pseudoalteromonas sp. SSDWG2 TaxID=3139391 RepID=UPI003BA9332E
MISLEITDQIAYVTFCRVEKRNALSFLMFKQLDNIIKKLKKNRQIRAVILQAQGEDFCTGLDVKSVMAKPAHIFSLLFKWLPGNQNLAQRVTLGWQQLNVPVIAAIQGRCWGGGMQIVLGADFRIATADASFAVMEAKWGLCPDMGASLLIGGLMKADDYLHLAMSADPICAQQAFDSGLITAISNSPLKAAQALVERMTERSPDTLAAIKRLNNTAYRYHNRRLLAKETLSQIRLLLNKNTRTAIYNASHDDKHEYRARKHW